MKTLREAAEMALEVLENLDVYGEYTKNATVRELRKVLAEPQRKPLMDESIGEVAIQDTQYHGYAMAIKPHIQVALEEGTKLYTAPPQRKPLTDEEILDVWKPFEGNAFTTKYEFARAIEQAHNIGEKE